MIKLAVFFADFGKFDNTTVYVHVVKLDNSNQTCYVVQTWLCVGKFNSLEEVGAAMPGDERTHWGDCKNG